MRKPPLRRCPTAPVKFRPFLGAVMVGVVLSVTLILYTYCYQGRKEVYRDDSYSSEEVYALREKTPSIGPSIEITPHSTTESQVNSLRTSSPIHIRSPFIMLEEEAIVDKDTIMNDDYSDSVRGVEENISFNSPFGPSDITKKESPFILYSDLQDMDGNRSAEALSFDGSVNDHDRPTNHKLNNSNSLDIGHVLKEADPFLIKTFSMVLPCNGSRPAGCFLHPNISFDHCQYKNCKYVTNYSSADVLGFYAFRIKSEEALPKLVRKPSQRWVMISPEAAARAKQFIMLDSPRLKGQFNWTLTYRIDSDIPKLYGKLRAIPAPRKNYQQIVASKNFTAAWFVSHCTTPSRRRLYVKRMQLVDKNIHIFGACGTRNCTDENSKRGRDQDVCFPMLTSSYFFYLAFENSLCVDYVTEKFFKLFQNVDIIPVVRGGADYKRYFPNDTFVDASDFDSPESLAKYLVDLAKNKDRYSYMLQEKNKYQYQDVGKWYCDLCKKMHTDQSVKWYPDLRSWFVDGKCFSPNDM